MTISTEPSNVLTSMKLSKRWLVYKSPPIRKQGQIVLNESGLPKLGKVPCYLNGRYRRGRLDTPEDINQLGTYEEAVSVITEYSHGVTGLGFALGYDPYLNLYWQGIDLDYVEKNKLQKYANEVKGYTEISPSNLGMHAIGIGRQFKSLGSNRSGVEAYSSARFFTVTLNNLRNSEPICLAEYVENELKPLHSLSNRNRQHVSGLV